MPRPSARQRHAIRLAISLRCTGRFGQSKPLNLQAEFRSPHHDTALVRAVWDGGSKWLIRFTPTEAGDYTFRLTSSQPAFNGKEGAFHRHSQ